MLPLKFSLLLLLLCYTGLAYSDWTGVSFDLGNYDSDWKFEKDTREAQISEIIFQIEERTETGLALGAGIGYLDLRVVAPSDSTAENLKFDGEFLQLYLRQPFHISENIYLQGAFSFRYNSGRESGGDDDRADIDWTQSVFELGLGLRYANLRIVPYAAYHDIDGDISDDGTDVFEMDEALIRGLRFDYFIEKTAFIRFDFFNGGSQGGYLNFVSRY